MIEVKNEGEFILMLKVDFHVHTYFSDGKKSPKDMVNFARKKGIYIAITDHDTSQGIKGVSNLGVIPGQEVTTEYGHVVILCQFPPSPPKGIGQLVDYSKENNCIVFPSHPFDILRAGIGDHVFNYKFDAIEIYNSKANRIANKKAKEASEKLSLPGLSNSDSHVPEALGSAYNKLPIEELNVEEILESIRKGKVEPIEVGLSGKAKFSIGVWYIQRKLRK